MINWQKTNVTSPPLLNDVEVNEDNLLILASKKITKNRDIKIDFKKLPCNTQAVERSVKLVTEASMSVCTAAAREGFIVNTLRSRNAMPQYNSKKDYKTGSKLFAELKL